MNVEETPLGKITPYARNPRVPGAAIEKVMASIEAFGFRQPIVTDAEGVIIAGHTRYEAARRLGLETAPVHVAAGLTPAQVKAYRLADNRVAQEAQWDYALLALELEDLGAMDFDLALTGFDGDEFAALFSDNEHERFPDDAALDDAIPSDLDASVWREWASEIVKQFDALISATGWTFQGVTPAYAKWCFLRAKHAGIDYPRHCSLAFHPQQLKTTASGAHRERPRSLLEGLVDVADGTFDHERLKFILGNRMSAPSLKHNHLAFAGARMPVDFPVGLARTLIDEFCPSGGSVLDACHGWGGRLVGFLLSHASTYVGVDVSPHQSDGVIALRDALLPLAAIGKQATLLCSAFETAPINDRFDFALTSPPYFNTEKYLGGSQSHRMESYAEWRDQFYAVLIEKVFAVLKPNSVFALQIGSETYPLLDDGRAIAVRCGFTPQEVRSTELYNHAKPPDEAKREVVLILKKDRAQPTCRAA